MSKTLDDEIKSMTSSHAVAAAFLEKDYLIAKSACDIAFFYFICKKKEKATLYVDPTGREAQIVISLLLKQKPLLLSPISKSSDDPLQEIKECVLERLLKDIPKEDFDLFCSRIAQFPFYGKSEKDIPGYPVYLTECCPRFNGYSVFQGTLLQHPSNTSPVCAQTSNNPQTTVKAVSRYTDMPPEFVRSIDTTTGGTLHDSINTDGNVADRMTSTKNPSSKIDGFLDFYHSY